VIVYADTSALVKVIRTEAGSADMERIIHTADLTATAAIAYAELRAAVAAAIRARVIPAHERDRIVSAVERLWEQLAEVPVDSMLIRLAGDLAEQQRLRGYDAVHLAALQTFGEPGDVTFACWDDDLRRAARALGYILLPV
jgi:uncharacterized protein